MEMMKKFLIGIVRSSKNCGFSLSITAQMKVNHKNPVGKVLKYERGGDLALIVLLVISKGREREQQ